jgi:nitrilase
MISSNNSAIVHPTVNVASVFAAPVMLDKTATVEKTCRIIGEAAKNGAQLVVFPESFIPGFPVWTAYRKPIDGHVFFKRFALNSLAVSGPEIRRIADVAAKNKIFVSLGFSEVSTISSGCLWNSNILIGDDGSLLNHHRKIMPTFYEKLVWASGDGFGLKVCATSIGRIGSLICGENNNTLARYSMIAQGEQIHTASFPSVWPFRNPLNNVRSYDLSQANKIRVSAHCFEGKVFSIVSSSFLDEESINILADSDEDAEKILRTTPRANAMIIGPEGDLIAEGGTDKEAIIYGELDLERAIELKQHHDLAGYYNRFDIFSFSVNQKRLHPIDTHSDAHTESRAKDIESDVAPLAETAAQV